MQRAVEVTIMGQRVTLRSEDDEEYIRSVAEYVDEKMREASRSTAPRGKYTAAVLVALNIADDYHRLKDNHEAAASRIDRLVDRLSAALSEDD